MNQYATLFEMNDRDYGTQHEINDTMKVPSLCVMILNTQCRMGMSVQGLSTFVIISMAVSYISVIMCIVRCYSI